MLPEIRKVKLPTLTLPTAWQTVIFRNYGYVSCDRIAAILECSEDIVRREAERLGIKDHGYAEKFSKSGYITTIRNNWYLLPYDQLITLLGMSEQELDFILEKEDFLGEKLGSHKPECDKIVYFPLSDEEIKATEKVRALCTNYSDPAPVSPFSFFEGTEQKDTVGIADGTRIIHGYLSPCHDAFGKDASPTLPDELLKMYQNAGISGIWLHGVLSELSPYPFDPARSADYKMRRENMKALIKRCAKYGIKLYLYFNEPRSLPVGADPKFEHLIGYPEKRTLCIEKPEVREYLYEAVRDLCTDVSDIGGIFTITMSEYPTHCNYRRTTNCPVCKNIPPQKSASDVNNIFKRAMRDSGCKGELIANLWCWSPIVGWTEEQIFDGISRLDPEISVMCVSEFDLKLEKGGMAGVCNEYSISNPGPSELTKKILTKASEFGHKTYAKIQASNSWECSAVPYIPAFDLVHEHVKNLHDINVKDYFLTWTLGGYPSPSVEIASLFKEGFSLDDWYKTTFGEHADSVHKAVLTICNAFREYPMSNHALYFSPKNLGPTNLWELEPEEKTSYMVGFSFDDVEKWTHPYPVDLYISQMRKLVSTWKRGLDALLQLPKTPRIDEVARYAEVAYLHFYTDLLQTEFSLHKRTWDKDAMRSCLMSERANAERLLQLMRVDAKIGFEASNHYSYTERNALEKMLRMEKFSALL